MNGRSVDDGVSAGGEGVRGAASVAWRGEGCSCLRGVVVRAGGGQFVLHTVTGGFGPYVVLPEAGCNGTLHGVSPAVGMHVNVIAPRADGGVVDGDLAVVEPDCLVDVSAVAACFEPYGESVGRYLLNGMKPRAGSAAVLLGNLASQFLDEAVHGADAVSDYATAVRKFFGRNGLAMAACRDLSPSFHVEARSQRDNISLAVRQLLGDDAARRGGAVIEPSFVCELLGLQGRIDLMQSDMKVLVEQKSGKSSFGGRSEGVFRPQVKHEVQLLLYMAVLHYGFGLRYDEVECFLLYSRYASGLVRVHGSSDLLARAMRLRNAMAVSLAVCARGGAARLLWNITPESLVTDAAGMAFMQHYSRHGIEELTRPLHDASPLEREYFLRMYRFIATEHLIAKTGGRGSTRPGFASVWLSPLADKEASGDIMAGLRLERAACDDAGEVTHLVMTFAAGGSPETANFRTGDTVIAYPDDGTGLTGVAAAFVFRASVDSLDGHTLSLRLRAPQHRSQLFALPEGWAWAVEHDCIESSHTSNYKALHQFLTATQRRRDLLMCRRRPDVDQTRHVRHDDMQGDLAELLERAWQARDLYMVQGPPGTGKTSHAMLGILLDQLQAEGSSVLLVACTNRAVDEMCARLIGDDGTPVVDFVRLGNGLSCPASLRRHLIGERLSRVTNVSAVRQLVTSTRVFAATVAALNASPQLFELKHFDLAIIDEASQIPEPHLLGLLSARHGNADAVDKFVMIGDDRQLPAVVAQDAAQSAVTETSLRAIGLIDCRLSLFERLLSVYGEDPQVTFMLSRQGRMHEEIAEFPNAEFYGGRLGIVPLPHQTAALDPVPDGADGLHRLAAGRRFAFIASPDIDGGTANDKVNLAEAAMTASLVCAVRDVTPGFDAASSVGVIVPYRSQAAAVRAAIERLCPDLGDVTVDTVERYQGSQRDTIIYAATVHDAGQLDFITSSTFATRTGQLVDRKLNVAMTRARQHLFVIGNAATLQSAPVYARLMDYARAKGVYVEVDEKNFCAGSF